MWLSYLPLPCLTVQLISFLGPCWLFQRENNRDAGAYLRPPDLEPCVQLHSKMGTPSLVV